MNFSRILIVTRKELMDSFRDRRSYYSVLLGALLGPLLIAFMLNRIAGEQRGAEEIRIPVAGREHAPVLVNWLEQQAGVTVEPGPSDAETAVRDSKLDFVLVIPKDFPEKFRASRPAPVQVVSDSTRQSSQAKVRRLRTLLGRFSGETGSLRLVARGVSPMIATALNVEDVEVSSAQQRSAMIFNVIPMFLVLACFTAAMQISTDSTAGERERGSLESLLVNPIPRRELVAGKWMAAVCSSLAGMVATLVVTTAVLQRLALEDLGFRFRFGTPEAMLLVAAVAPMALIAPSVQMYLASFAKSFKEAQSYMGFLILLPMLPGMLAAFYPMSNKPWMAPIPVMGQYALSSDIMSGKPPGPLLLIAAALSAAAFALIFLVLTTRLFSRERIIFGSK